MKHAQTAAVVWGEQPPAHSIGYGEPMWPSDSGFSILFSDAPDPSEVEDHQDPDELPDGITLVCLHCLLDDHPELGRGLDIAREHGVADLEEGQWVVGDVSRL